MNAPSEGSKQSTDWLNRKKIAEDLADKIFAGSFLKGDEAKGTMVIDGAYGTGKTSVIRFLQDALKGKGVRTMYFDAWENENFADPIVPFLAAIKKYFGVSSSSWAELEKIAEYLPSNCLGVIDLKTSVQTLAQWRGKYNSPTEEFKSILGEVLAEGSGKSEHVKLVIFVDELDRCKPTFAFQLLERIKHLFCIDKMLFVVGMDMRTMEGMVKKFYGSPDPSGYLLKFFDRRVLLPDPDRRAFMHALMRKLSPSLMQTESFAGGIMDGFLVVASLFKFNLRQLMKAGQELSRLETTIAKDVSILIKQEDTPGAGDTGEIIGITEAIRVHDQVLAEDIFLKHDAQKGYIELLKFLIRQTKIIGVNQVDISEKYDERESSRRRRLFIVLVRTTYVGFRCKGMSFNGFWNGQKELSAEVNSIFGHTHLNELLDSWDKYLVRESDNRGWVYTFDHAYRLLDEGKDL